MIAAFLRLLWAYAPSPARPIDRLERYAKAAAEAERKRQLHDR